MPQDLVVVLIKKYISKIDTLLSSFGKENFPI
jgi:hypothetical protein